MTNHEMGEKIAVIESVVVRLESKLFGNGQPGVIGKLENRVAELEITKAKATGAIWLVSLVSVLLSFAEAFHWFHFKK